MNDDSPSGLRLTLSGALTTALLDGGLALLSGTDDTVFLLSSIAATFLLGLPLFAAISWAPRLSLRVRTSAIAFVVTANTVTHGLHPAGEAAGQPLIYRLVPCAIAMLVAAWVHRAGIVRNFELLAPALTAWTLAATWTLLLGWNATAIGVAWLVGALALVRIMGTRHLRYGTACLLGAALLVSAGVWPAVRPQPRFHLQSAQPRSAVSPPRRVLLITIDTLRADRVSAIHSGRTRTPHIDALATDGVLFSQARSRAPWTLPAMASIMTGLSPEALGLVRWSAVQDVSTLAGRLRNAGFVTAAMGANSVLRAEAGLARGFTEYHFFPQSAHQGRSFGTKLLRELRPERYGERTRSTRQLTDDALSWIELHRERDFFLWLHYLDPHVPYAPPEAQLRGLEPADRIGQQFDQASVIRNGGYALTMEEREWLRELYDAEVRHVDESIGRLLEQIRALKLYDDALIILTSDHGEEFWEHGAFEHGHSLYDELLRVPLIVKPVGGVAQRRVHTAVSTQALFATVLDRCSLEIPDFAIPTLAPLWRGAPGAPRPPIVGSSMLYGDEQISILDGRYKYIRNLNTGAEQLFDIDTDPLELHPRTDLQEALASTRDQVAQYTRHVEELRRELDLGDSPSATPHQQTLDLLRSLGYTN